MRGGMVVTAQRVSKMGRLWPLRLSVGIVAFLVVCLPRAAGASCGGGVPGHASSPGFAVRGRQLTFPDYSCAVAVSEALRLGRPVAVPKDTCDPKWCAAEMARALRIQRTVPEPTPWVPAQRRASPVPGASPGL